MHHTSCREKKGFELGLMLHSLILQTLLYNRRCILLGIPATTDAYENKNKGEILMAKKLFAQTIGSMNQMPECNEILASPADADCTY